MVIGSPLRQSCFFQILAWRLILAATLLQPLPTTSSLAIMMSTSSSSSTSSRSPPNSPKSFYKRPLPDSCIALSSKKGKQIFASALANHGLKSFFPLMEQLYVSHHIGLGNQLYSSEQYTSVRKPCFFSLLTPFVLPSSCSAKHDTIRTCLLWNKYLGISVKCPIGRSTNDMERSLEMV